MAELLKPNEERDAQCMPCVLWYPVRCPECGMKPDNTDGVRMDQRLRFHTCPQCGLRFKSLMAPVSNVRTADPPNS